jgi:hypothetical protein
MVDLSQDVDAYIAQKDELVKILIGGKTEAQKAEVVALLKKVVAAPEGPTRKAAMARLFERLKQMHMQTQAGHPSA